MASATAPAQASRRLGEFFLVCQCTLDNSQLEQKRAQPYLAHTPPPDPAEPTRHVYSFLWSCDLRSEATRTFVSRVVAVSVPSNKYSQRPDRAVQRTKGSDTLQNGEIANESRRRGRALRHHRIGLPPTRRRRHEQRHAARPEPLRRPDAGPATRAAANGATTTKNAAQDGRRKRGGEGRGASRQRA